MLSLSSCSKALQWWLTGAACAGEKLGFHVETPLTHFVHKLRNLTVPKTVAQVSLHPPCGNFQPWRGFLYLSLGQETRYSGIGGLAMEPGDIDHRVRIGISLALTGAEPAAGAG